MSEAELFDPDSLLVNNVSPSPNFGERRLDIDMLVLHYTATQTGQKACDWLCNRESEVSAHYLVMEDAQIRQLVPENKRAHHAGVSSWQGETDQNSRSIGIEIQHVGSACTPYSERQIEIVMALCKDIITRYNIMPQMILGHSDIAPSRKQDPGAFFPWARLAKHDIGHWVAPHPIVPGPFLQLGDSGQPVEAMQAMLALYGYGIPISGQYDQITQTVVTAFQRHFRPENVDGIADRSTVETLVELIRRQPKEPQN